MWVKLRVDDIRVIAHYVGVLVIGMGVMMIVPLVTALLVGEWAAALDYFLGMGVAAAVGMALALLKPKGGKLNNAQALAITASSWLFASLVGAVPLSLAHNYPTYLDALFDVVSGLTTSGLTVVVDLDHMALAHNMWRHLTHLIGGQGIVVAALSFAIGSRGGSMSLYLAEGRDERILPNVIHTVRFIWFVTAVYVTLGTLALFINNVWLGLSPTRSLLHAFWISIAAYDTGGFGPQSMNAMYYHSWVFETLTMFLMIAGTMNFSLHAQVWRGDPRELFRNLETRVLAGNIAILSALCAIGFAGSKYFSAPFPALRKGLYHLVSAHSGTGHQTLYPAQWSAEYGGAALVAVMLAMAFGGAASSTAGGIKALRVGLILKSVLLEVRRSLAPRSAVLTSRFHHMTERVVSSGMTGSAATILILYTVTYITGAAIGAAYGYPVGDALFESISATANVGLSTGITAASMPTGLKILYMLQMWAGRLEFIAVFALVAHMVLWITRRRSAT